MNDALSVPSPSRFWSTFGMRSAARKTLAYADVPRKCACADSRTSPAIRLKRMPAATQRAERAGGEASATSVGRVTGGQGPLDRGPLLEEPVQELALVTEPL